MFLALTVGIKKRSDSKVAQKTWELENSILTVPLKPSSSRRSLDSWANDRHYFKCCMISVLALLKMVARARSGGTTVVMGLMQGKTDADSIIVMYAFALHVEDTETRVNANADADAYEYMVDYYQTNEQVITRPKLMAFERLKTGNGDYVAWQISDLAEKLEQVETRESNATRLHWPTRPSSKEVPESATRSVRVRPCEANMALSLSNLKSCTLALVEILQSVSMKDHPDYPSLHDCSLSLSLDCKSSLESNIRQREIAQPQDIIFIIQKIKRGEGGTELGYGIPKESNPNQQQPSDFSVIGQPRVLALRRRDLGLHCLLSRWFNLGFYWKLIYRYTSWEF
ncbi:hypothetical protein V6N13_081619 [Hibiscus sabdariffa]